MPRLTDIQKAATIPDTAHRYLERMQLDHPESIKERLLQRVLVYALASVNVI
jgi:hypothetical protein